MVEDFAVSSACTSGSGPCLAPSGARAGTQARLSECSNPARSWNPSGDSHFMEQTLFQTADLSNLLVSRFDIRWANFIWEATPCNSPEALNSCHLGDCLYR